jgi:hypothetical protein
MIRRMGDAATIRPEAHASRQSVLLGLATACMVVWQSGVYVDIWYHIHRGVQIDSFLTWPHALLYAGWLAAGLVVASGRVWIVGPLPRGYRTFLIGWTFYGFGGLADFLWHTAFGFEVGQEAVLSPAHSWLALGFTVTAFGLLEVAARSRASAGTGGYLLSLADLPLVLGLAMIFNVSSWYFVYASPLTIDLAAGGAISARLPAYHGIAWTNAAAHIAGTTGILIHSVMTTLFVVASLRHFRLPVGSIVAMLLYAALLILSATDQWSMLPAVVASALVGEGIWLWMRRGGPGGTDGAAGYWIVGGAVPLVQCLVGFLMLDLAGADLIWTPHLLVGVPVAAGILGLTVSVLVVPPEFARLPDRSR